MKIEEIRNCLVNNYLYHDSLYLGKHRKSNSEYYYNINYINEIENIMYNLKELPKEFDFNNLVINFYNDDKKLIDNASIIVQLINYDDSVILRFCFIKGIMYKKYYGDIIPKLVLSDSFINLEIDLNKNTFFWINDKHSKKKNLMFNYYLNKLLFKNIEFRKVFIDLLKPLSNRYYIFKDLIRDIKKDHFCLLPLTIEQFKQHYNKKELMNNYFPNDLPLNFNKYSLNSIYYKSRLLMNITRDDYNKLAQFNERKIISYVDLFDLYNGINIQSFAQKYYKDILNIKDNQYDDYIIDYVDMCINNNQTISLDINSLNDLIVEHENAINRYMNTYEYKDIDKQLIKKDTKYLSLRKLLPDEFEWIDTNKRLYDEGSKQHNCVFSYRDKIYNDQCTIYHFEIEDRKYTIEFSIDNYGEYYIKQMKQKNNKNFVVSDYEYVNSFLRRDLE